MYVCVCIYIYVHIYTYVHIYIYICVCVYVRMYLHSVYTSTFIYTVHILHERVRWREIHGGTQLNIYMYIYIPYIYMQPHILYHTIFRSFRALWIYADVCSPYWFHYISLLAYTQFMGKDWVDMDPHWLPRCFLLISAVHSTFCGRGRYSCSIQAQFEYRSVPFGP